MPRKLLQKLKKTLDEMEQVAGKQWEAITKYRDQPYSPLPLMSLNFSLQTMQTLCHRENVEWLLELGSNHVKSANWSKDPWAIVVTMTRNIDKNRMDGLPDGKHAFDTLNKVVLDLFPGATLANRKPQSKFRFTRIPTQHSDGLPMDNGLLYHYIRKHPNFENVRFSLTPRFERSRPLKPGQVARTKFTKTVICEIFDTETGAIAKKCLGSVVKFDGTPATCKKFVF
ncbi:hypothetical protein AMATHDRAFT_9556 [Amanita thiersii Skay4041]|uniref:Uncharacterized protein n=1 Tax=Amanita thiersii Skay4041 TaxID=703135 RepID=A0A2A9NAL0_9AGAR|nr:hypothetical protein AMATHDRAFT_9556 [Amanita thiersii Skay4041]